MILYYIKFLIVLSPLTTTFNEQKNIFSLTSAITSFSDPFFRQNVITFVIDQLFLSTE